jgi:hypothetical protein
MADGDYGLINGSLGGIYQGGYSSFSPSYGDVFTGYRANVNQLGITTLPNTANMLKEVADKANMGVKNIDLSLINPEIFDQVPKQHLKEINRIAKLAGVEVDVHGPLMEPSGMTQQGFTETNRQAVERQLQEQLERSHEIRPDGNIVVNFHTSNMFPAPEVSKVKDPETGEFVEKTGSVFVVDTESGGVGRIPIKDRTEFGKNVESTPESELKAQNEQRWTSQLSQISYYANQARAYLGELSLPAILADIQKQEGKTLDENQKRAISQFNQSISYLNDSYRSMRELYDNAAKHASPEDKKLLKEFTDSIGNKVEFIQGNPNSEESILKKQEIVEDAIDVFNKINPPEQIVLLDDFSREKSATTFGNAAFGAFKKFGEKAPIVAIENPPAGFQFARGKDVKDMVEKSRAQFVKKAIMEGYSKSEAEENAEKLIGATWDVGHINMLRKFGYSEKDIIKETKEVAPLIKHVHLSDNFGYEHTELPMGMGNVPLKKMMEALGKKGKEAKKLIEAGTWWTQFGNQGANPPFAASLEGMGSPILSAGGGPYWNQAIGLQQGYFGGYGAMLPSINYQTFGAGFSQLPQELGGQVQQGGGRMGGTPME